MDNIQAEITNINNGERNRIALQELLINISAKFINHDLSDIETLIESSLQQIGEFVNADRSYVFTYDFENKTTSNTYEWCGKGIEPEKDNLQNVPIDFIKDWVDAHKKREAFYVPNVKLLPESENEYSLRNILEPQGIQSLIAIPQTRDNQVVGFVGFDSVNTIHNYSETEKDILFVFANMVATVQQRKIQQDIIKEQEEKKELLLRNLSAQNEKLNDYAHIVCHDLKSPLINIHNLVEWFLIDNQSVISEDKLQPMRAVLSNVEKMDALIKGILDYSVATQEEELSVYDVDLNEVLKDILNIISIPTHIEIKVDNNLPTIFGNNWKFQQLFQNLIQNAIKFIDKERGLIEVNFIDNGEFYQFSVSDNGVGIKEIYFDKIFKTFTKLESTSTSSGIGLSIVKKIVESYSGEIWLQSELNKGTTFYFTLKK